ncbi:hypothetical protein [Aromatoleum buckelii]|uniref:Uncharacterized protein n=1 Tax=Aromatoleum buckelii TaxID=200254 RepID=A0ABX1N0I8_9RHOO|nr:hypothetical protein [Aromatoleum buckelii]MCK0511159.1 hypothetical protein [Aromatoleum buckelii]
MNAPQPTSPRRRMQELLEIPDSQRTEAEWDELIELEISMAPGNREGAPQPGARRMDSGTGGPRKPGRHAKPGSGQPRSGPQGPRPPAQPKPQGQAKPAEDGQPRKPARKFRKRPPKETPPQ